jgi:hypothetical protein
MPRRFPPPWSIEERQEPFIVKDANGHALALAVPQYRRPIFAEPAFAGINSPIRG